MPIYAILCPDCGNVARTLVLADCRMPEEWACSACGGLRAQPDPHAVPQPHPWEAGHGGGCLCCGGSSSLERAQQGVFECRETNDEDTAPDRNDF